MVPSQKFPFIQTQFFEIISKHFVREWDNKSLVYLRRDANSFSCDGGPPHHKVGECSNPEDASQESDREKLFG
jgi:hypothetical protein